MYLSYIVYVCVCSSKNDFLIRVCIYIYDMYTFPHFFGASRDLPTYRNCSRVLEPFADW